jgi:hypothetical protein
VLTNDQSSVSAWQLSSMRMVRMALPRIWMFSPPRFALRQTTYTE